METWDKIVKDAKLEERMSAIRLSKAAQQEADTKTPVDIAARDMQKDARRVG